LQGVFFQTVNVEFSGALDNIRIKQPSYTASAKMTCCEIFSFLSFAFMQLSSRRLLFTTITITARAAFYRPV
jgi:hypothetical protein